MNNAAFPATSDHHPLQRSRQCLIVTTDSWNATRGKMAIFERDGPAKWKSRGPVMPVVLGKSGLAWGRGLLNPSLPGPVKVERDNKAPAGVFRLNGVFGYSPRSPGTKMSYLALSKNIVAVDDPKSRSYNRLIDRTKIKMPDWQSAENMILADDRYKWGVIVAHNVPPKPGAGSCIFLHVWKSPTTTTTGCTAMAERDLIAIIRWLDPAKHPLLIQMPAHIYSEVRAKWRLPAL
jgi:D-alanyl-D-alanine dipeptidase